MTRPWDVDAPLSQHGTADEGRNEMGLTLRTGYDATRTWRAMCHPDVSATRGDTR